MVDEKGEKPAGKKEQKDSGKPEAKRFQPQQLPSKLVKRKDKESKDFRGIVRVVGRDVDGHLTVSESLRKIKGVGFNLASSLSGIISSKIGIGQGELIGNLNEEQLSKVEDVVRFPQNYGVRAHFLNRVRDFESGQNKHFVMADLSFALRQDVTRERDSRTYKGWRHSIGQKVRGQHTRTSGRTGMTVGVLKKAIKAQKAAAAAGAQEKAGGAAAAAPSPAKEETKEKK